MNDKIIIFAALKSFYDSGSDLLGVFSNLILLSLAENGGKVFSVLDIKQKLLSKIDFNIPEDVIQTLLKRLKANNFIDYSNIKDHSIKSIKITEAGLEHDKKIRDDYKNAEREKNAILSKMKESGLNYSNEILSRELNIFIEESVECAISILDNGSKNINNNDNKIKQEILDFFIKSEKSDPETFEHLKTFLYGKILSNSFLRGRFDPNAKIENLSVYLDTNIIFSLLSLHEDSFNSSAKEIIDLMNKLKIEIRVFDFTIDETKNKLRGYLNEFGYYSGQIRVNSIYYVMKRKNMSKLDVLSLIESFDKKMEELGITIDYSQNLNNLLKDKENDLSQISIYKQSSSVNSVRHDLGAIFAIKNVRNNKKHYLWEKSGSLFLTSDFQLSSYDFIKHNHKESGTFPEIIHRTDFTSLLWVKGQSGSDNVFIHNLFASQIREKMVNLNLWNKFTEELKKRRESGSLSQDDIDYVVSLSETEMILREKGEIGISEILNDENLNKIKEKSEKNEKYIKENEEVINTQNEKLLSISNKIIEESKIFWNKAINIIVWVLVFIIFLIVVLSISKWGISLVSSIIQLFVLISIVVIALSITKKAEIKPLSFLINLRSNIENRQITKSIEKKKKKFGII